MAIFYVELELAGDPRLPACRGEDPNLFVGPDGEGRSDREFREEQAKSICRTCDVVTECFVWAMTNRERGVWGNTTDDERFTIRTGRKMKDPDRASTNAGRIKREERAWALHLEGYSRHEIAKELGVKPDTVYDYLKSQRRVRDHEAGQDSTAEGINGNTEAARSSDSVRPTSPVLDGAA